MGREEYDTRTLLDLWVRDQARLEQAKQDVATIQEDLDELRGMLESRGLRYPVGGPWQDPSLRID